MKSKRLFIVLAVLLCSTMSVAFAFQYFYTTEQEQIHAGLILTSRTIVVPDNYTTIQEAINAAGNGDTIYVRNGTYYEHVVLNKTVSLIGEDRETTIVDGNGIGKVVHVVVDNVNISHFTIQNSGPDYPDGGGIYLSGSRSCNLSFNILANNYVGIWLWSSTHNYLINNTAFNCSCSGIELRVNSDHNILVCNNLSRNLRGINIPRSSHNLIINNTAAHNIWDGIHAYSYSSYNDFTNNNLSNNNFSGIDLDSYSSNNNLTENTIYNNNVVGIRIGYSCSNNRLADNLIINTRYELGYGIYLYDYAKNSLLVSNIVADTNGTALGLSKSSNNTIYHNNFVNNTKQVGLKDSSNNTWDNGCEGNYWSNYNGSDLDDDGIGDTPYAIDGNNTDNCPLINPYWLPGDVNHDLKINIYDVVRITGVYGSEQGDPNWNCHSDIAEPYGIINIYDVVTCTKDYRKEYTP